ncbi:contractile injection system protein, VgrG/Pvc8 family (plasmid) [Orbus sturtevantii]|uniref:phage baseplate assembly protein n=1 Tax=Orbus sturtevantii TaxID=3074109 RepID=UPI00370D4FB4
MNDDLILRLDDKEIIGWDSLRVSRSIERFPTNFSLSLMDNYDVTGNTQIIRPGRECQIYLGSDLVCTGYIDQWMVSKTSTSHQVNVSGRGKCQDLVDCSANWPNNVISNTNVIALCQKLANSYGIKVKSNIKNFQILPQFNLNWGETSQEIIDRICRWAGLLYYELPDGSLYLTRVNNKKAASGIEEGKNIEKYDYSVSLASRYSEYSGISISALPLQELGTAGYSQMMVAKAKDPDYKKLRFRNKITIVESTMTSAKLAQDCINWEMNRRYGRSKQIKVTLDSWRDSSGALWEQNTLVPVNIPSIDLKNELWLIASVEYQKGKKGTRCDMILMPPEAFIVEPFQFYSPLAELQK